MEVLIIPYTAYPADNIGLDNYIMGETQLLYAPVYGFVADYWSALPPSYAEATFKVKGSCLIIAQCLCFSCS